MKIAVMGAGAVGCYYGGMLARAGHEVVLVARAAHVEAVRRAGLLLETLSFTEHVRLQADTEARGVQDAQCVLFCVKSTDTESAGQAMKPHLAPDAVVLSLQNGVDNAERLQAVLGACRTWGVDSENRPQRDQFLPDLPAHSPAMGQKDGEKWAAAVDLQPTIPKFDRLPGRPVLPAVVYVAAGMAGPGHVRHHGRGDLVIAPAPQSASIAQTFAAAGIPVQVSDNVAGALWAKLVLNCVYNPLSALTGLAYGAIVDSPGLNVPRMMDDIVQECLAVARAQGVVLPAGTAEAVLPLAASMPTQISSTAQDLARGRPTEIDHLNGYIVRQGEALGIATPANRMLLTLVHLREKQMARQRAA